MLKTEQAYHGNERSLHLALKKWYSSPIDRLEVFVKDYIIDIMRGELLIEIQTCNFSAIKDKIYDLIQEYNLRLVYPIATIKWLLYISPNEDRIIRKRKSPKQGRPINLFYELVRIPRLLNNANFELEVLMIEEAEIRCNDGKGSWRRRGSSLKDHILLKVIERLLFTNGRDLFNLLPKDITQPFSNKELAKTLRIPVNLARKVTYSMNKMDILEIAYRKRNAPFFSLKN